jgi:alkanesulfonate monooxygenase SsuD/methylene tetrahydromethanopterin reductase-like flavin-dependent oxidoreductase (luciferase family)
VRAAVFLPVFGELAEPRVLADLAARAEEEGWSGAFVWDHMLYEEPVVDVADPWVAMAAMACATSTLVLGPMVTPVARRRPQKLAREAVTLDRLSGGRLVLGVGLGGDRGGELSRFGEELDARRRAARFDEGLELLDRFWTGATVDHDGPNFEVHDVRLRPVPVQRPRIPIWCGAVYPHRAPLRRAARWDGLFPVGLQRPDQLTELLAVVAEHRRSPDPFAVAVQGGPDDDPGPWAAAGATWWLTRFDPFTVTADEVRGVISAGPPPGLG